MCKRQSPDSQKVEEAVPCRYSFVLYSIKLYMLLTRCSFHVRNDCWRLENKFHRKSSKAMVLHWVSRERKNKVKV
jgi:hypothetical protein